MQIFGDHFFAVPRFIWVLLISVVTLALSLGGRNVLQHILENLLPLLGYWTICFATVLFIEHYMFRPKLGGYDLEGWRDSKRTPVGLAGVATLCAAIGLSFLGMNQTWVSRSSRSAPVVHLTLDHLVYEPFGRTYWDIWGRCCRLCGHSCFIVAVSACATVRNQLCWSVNPHMTNLRLSWGKSG